jgi:hypothetical protein
MESTYVLHPYYMKHFVLSLLIVFTLSANAQAPSVKRLVALFKGNDATALTTYADSHGYNAPSMSFDIGNMCEYSLQTYTNKDTTNKNQIVYSSGYHYEMNQGPLMVSISYYTSSKTEFDALIDEIKALGAKEFFYKDGDPYYHLYNYAGVNISTYQNNRGEGAKYRISLNTSYR